MKKIWQKFTERDLTIETRLVLNVLGLGWFYNAKSLFIAVSASLHWLNIVSCLFVSSLLITSGPDVQTKTIKTGALIIFLSSPPRCGSLEPEHRRRKTLKIVVLEKQQEKVEYKKDNLFNVYSSLGRYVFGSEISYNKAPPRLPGLGC